MNKYSFILFSFCFLIISGIMVVFPGKSNGKENANIQETSKSNAMDSFSLKKKNAIDKDIDHAFLATLRAAGINKACIEMGIDFDETFAPLAAGVNHPYRQYRWSVSRDENDNTIIHALPPQEEMGWTPWERWSMRNNLPVRSAWVLYPVQEPVTNGIVRWYCLEESENLIPRLLHKTDNLETILQLSRVDVAAEWLGMDLKAVFLDPLNQNVKKIYSCYRWVVIPHTLANDGPVIYALPPMDKSDDWPWESWYSDGKIPVIHHVHYTLEKSNTTGSWKEGPGAPQRPPEIFGHTWYWYDDPDLIPALAK